MTTVQERVECSKCRKKLNKAITVALSKLMSKTRRKHLDLPPALPEFEKYAVYIFNKDDFTDFIKEIRKLVREEGVGSHNE